MSEESSPEVVPEAGFSSSAPPTKKTKLTPPPPDSQIAPPSSLSLFSLLKKSARSIARVEKRGKASSTKAGSSEESDDEGAHQSDSSSSSESSSSSSASSSSSSSSGSSSSSSSSGDSSAPSLRSSKPTTQPKHSTQPKPSTTIRLTPIIPSQPPVPPGEGSSATRERNLRRRKKAAALKAMGAASASASPAPSTTANQTPQPTDRASCSADAEMEDVDAALRVLTPDFLPTQPDQEAVTASFVAAATRANPDPTLAISYTTAANRNKSKAFKKAAAGGLAGFKTLFDSPVSASAPATPASAPSTSTPARLESAHSAPTYNAVPPPSSLSTPTTSSKKRKSGRSSLVPSQPSTPRVYLPAPSDRPPTSLPKAMFVSSVDVEDPVWEASVGGGVWAAYLGLEEDKVKEQVWEKGAMQLDYGTEEAAPVVSVLQKGKEKEDESAQDAGKTEGGSKKKVDLTWDALDELYEGSTGSLPWENLKVGSAVIYKVCPDALFLTNPMFSLWTARADVAFSSRRDTGTRLGPERPNAAPRPTLRSSRPPHQPVGHPQGLGALPRVRGRRRRDVR